jgi:hypothetical protein
LTLRVQLAVGDFLKVSTAADQIVTAVDGELRIVEDVEGLGTELQPEPLGELEARSTEGPPPAALPASLVSVRTVSPTPAAASWRLTTLLLSVALLVALVCVWAFFSDPAREPTLRRWP